MYLAEAGVLVEEHTDDGGPYKIWSADMWRCRYCNNEVISGFAKVPQAHHFDSAYEKIQANVQYHIRSKKQ